MAAINAFAKWLTTEAKKRGFGAKEISNQAGLSTSAIRELRNGERYPTAHEVSLLKRCFPALQHQKAMTTYAIAEAEKAAKRAFETTAPKESKEKAAPAQPEVMLVASPPEKNAPKPSIETAGVAPAISPLKINTKRQEGQYTRIEEIDPNLAEMLLTGNIRNRDVSSVQVDTFAREMLEGRWLLSHQGIAVDNECRLVDGQHRLHAIIKSGTTQRMPVTYNVDPDAYRVVDTNLRQRSAVDVLRMAERAGTPLVSIHATTANAAAVKIIGNAVRNTAITKWSLAEVQELLNRYSEVAEVAKLCGRSKESRRAGVVAGMTYAYPVYPEVVTDFCKRISTQEHMDKLHAAYIRAVARIESGLYGNIEVMQLSLRAIRRAKEGDFSMGKLYTKDPEETDVQKDASFQHFVFMRQKKGLPV